MPPLKVNFWELPSFRQKFPAGLQVHQRCSRITSLSQQVISLQTNVANVILVEKKLKLTFGRNSVCRCFRPQTLVLNTKTSPLNKTTCFQPMGLTLPCSAKWSLLNVAKDTLCFRFNSFLRIGMILHPGTDHYEKFFAWKKGTAAGRGIGN